MVVLEVPDDNEASKATSDSEKCTWAELLREMEDSEVHDPTINSHELLAPVTDGGKEPSKNSCKMQHISTNCLIQISYSGLKRMGTKLR